MKAITFCLTVLTFALGLTACNSDDDLTETTAKKNSDSVQPKIAFNDLNIFENSIIENDENGQMTGFFYGEQLDASNPRHIFIGVDNMKEAEQMFQLWFAPDVELRSSANGLSATLTDENGQRQGEVFLTEGTEENHVAEMTVSSDTKLKHFDQITFLLNSAWPVKLKGWQNHYCKFDIVRNFELGGIAKKLDSTDKELNLVCIQSGGNGVKPIFCTITNHKYYNPLSKLYLKQIRQSKYCPGEVTAPTAYTIQKILLTDWDGFVEAFNEAGSGTHGGGKC